MDIVFFLILGLVAEILFIKWMLQEGASIVEKLLDSLLGD